jgi:hypothetical protein
MLRRRTPEAALLAGRAVEPAADATPSAAARDVGAVLRRRLAPQECAALVRKKLFVRVNTESRSK